MTLTDSKTGQIIREKELSTPNDIRPTSWTFVSTDAYIPKDAGSSVQTSPPLCRSDHRIAGVAAEKTKRS